jgi:hypothetical protein
MHRPFRPLHFHPQVNVRMPGPLLVPCACAIINHWNCMRYMCIYSVYCWSGGNTQCQWGEKALCRNTCRTVPPTEPKRRKRKEEKGAHVCIYIVIFTTRHERRSAKSTSCGRDRPQDPTFRGRTPTYQHTTYSNPRQSIQQCNDAQTCSAAADSHHKSGHDRPSHHAQRSNIST